ncbi:hypothetical protein NP493_393g01009 [Ridgeia piscesae]|uniref:Reverse transcriptase domain-containing protein n=1 Tax=Ridgeia piscesae TaxID=27915 RepID=A0AAD9L2H1_RIDPI|nr:hypothetical protein NP493_393g01009 [Ridgeia piscesae]
MSVLTEIEIPEDDIDESRLALDALTTSTTVKETMTNHAAVCILPEVLMVQLADESENHGLKLNKSKTNVMMEDIPIFVNSIQIENVESYVYLGQRYSTRDKNQDKEIQRRITTGWTAFAKHRDIFKGNIGT